MTHLLLYHPPIIQLISSFLLHDKPINHASILERIHARRTCKTWHRVIKEQVWPGTYRLKVCYLPQIDSLHVKCLLRLWLLPDDRSHPVEVCTLYQRGAFVSPPSVFRSKLVDVTVIWFHNSRSHTEDTRRLLDCLDPNILRVIAFEGVPMPDPLWCWLNEYPQFALKFSIRNAANMDRFHYIHEWNECIFERDIGSTSFTIKEYHDPHEPAMRMITKQEAHTAMVRLLCTGQSPEPTTISTQS